MAEENDVRDDGIDTDGRLPQVAADGAGQADPQHGEREAQPADTGPVDYDKVISEALAPEGFTLDPGLTREAGELLARHDIPAEAAKELAGFFARQQKAGAEGNARAFADQVGAWRAQAEKRTTPQERGVAKEAALRIFDRDELAVLELFGVANRTGFIKALAKVGEAIRDDPFVRGNAPANGARDARSHFPNSNMNP